MSTWSLLQELSESPQKVLDKLASSLPFARNFFVSYVMLSGLLRSSSQHRHRYINEWILNPRSRYHAVAIIRTRGDHSKTLLQTIHNSYASR